MAQRFEFFTVTAPASTLKSAPLTVATSFQAGVVTRIELVVPDGHAGLTGIRFANAGVPVIPFSNGAFLISNDEKIGWDVEGFLDDTTWSAQVFNTDVFDHSFFVRYLVSENAPSGAQVAPIIAPLAVPDIMAAVGG